MDAPGRAAEGGTRRWWTLGAVCVGIFMLLLDLTIVNVALPDIARDFHASLPDLQWVIDAYALTLAALLLTSGSLADQLGRRAVFAVGIVVFTLGSLLCGTSTGPLFIILARGFQGIGGAIMFATSLALLANAFHGKERGVAFGIYGAVTGIAVAVGPVLGGVITSGLSWRWIFFVNLPIGAAALAITLTQVDESRNPAAGRTDWAGFATFSGALAALVYGLIESSTKGWGAVEVAVPLACAAALLAVFVVVERVQRRPMFDLSLLRIPTFTGGLVAAFGINGSVFALFTYLVLYLQDALGLSAVATGVRFLLLTGATFVTAAIAGRLTSHVPIRWLIGPGFAVAGVGTILMTGLSTSSSWAHLAVGFVVAGAGVGLVNVPLASTAVGVVEPARSGMASGINSTLRQVGTATGIALLGSLFASKVRATIVGSLAHTPLRSASSGIAAQVTGGSASLSPPPGGLAAPSASPVHQLVDHAALAGFAHGLNEILWIAGILAIVSGILSFLLIRQRDFAAPATARATADGTIRHLEAAGAPGADEGSFVPA
ncbi:MAG TPA: MFS transporter [Acidimicrobiales bacterium]|nr:MFS transporter [Acidimicrobiales bacterium]